MCRVVHYSSAQAAYNHNNLIRNHRPSSSIMTVMMTEGGKVFTKMMTTMQFSTREF